MSKEVTIVDDKAVTAEKDIDVKEPRSVIALLPRAFREMAEDIPPSYFQMSPEDLEKYAFAAENKKQASHIYKQLRLRLWEHYDWVQANDRPHLLMRKICEGVCTYQHLSYALKNDPAKFAWLLIPPPDYLCELKALYEIGAKRMKEILEIEVDDKTNPKIMDTQFRIHQNIEMRIHGAVIQRVDERRLNVNVNAQASAKVTEEANKAAAKMSMEEVELRIKELQAETERLTSPAIMHKVEMINKRPQTIMDVNGNAPKGD